ncbi:MAG TPA: isochorismate synthase [Polyangiaceae bacterium]
MTDRAEAVTERRDAGLDAREILSQFARELTRVRSSARLTTLTLAAPRVPAERLLQGRLTQDACAWCPPGDLEASGRGSAALLSATGENRIRQIERQATDLWSDLDTSLADPRAPHVRLLGGFSFNSGSVRSESWLPFGEARFTLPRVSYVHGENHAWLRFTAPAAELSAADRREALCAELAHHLEALNQAPRSLEPAREVAREERTAEEWAKLVGAVQREIRAGTVQKIVAARRVALTLDREILPAAVLSRLRKDARECTRFALSVAGTTFLGATPERLILKRVREICTDALAGSVGSGDRASAHRLLESSKDIHEHEFVVREILRVLEPLSEQLTRAAEREIHELRTVLHLRTKIFGTLKDDTHVLRLVADLHPTPAVGGVPTAAAVSFIAEHEPDERGWYAGPFGWFDAAGDGEFVVALRSGLVHGRHVELYGGAGIVRESDAESEFIETRWKLAALADALGVHA